MRVLIDRNIEINAVTHKTVLVPRHITWGGHVQIVEVAERAHFPPAQTETFRKEQLPYLASLCVLAKQRQLEFFSSDELLMERARQRGPSGGYLGIDLLRDVPVKTVRCPVPRTIVFGSTGNVGATEDEQMQFFRSIQHPRFLQIRNAVGDAHIDDAFHLWAAEEAQMEIFLTMDRRFWRIVNQKAKVILTAVRVMTPKQLAEHLKAAPMDIETLAREKNPFD